MNKKLSTIAKFVSVFLLVMILVTIVGSVPQTAVADHTPDPSSVAITGSLQSELGCPDDWQAECPASELSFDAEDDVWQQTFNVPAGDYEYKATLNDSWDENYGANAQQDGSNIPLSLGAATDVKFYYAHESHWVTDNVNSVIAVTAGSFQDELGCGGDWDPSCLRSWLQDPDGDGVFTFTAPLPDGSYEGKVTIDEGWDENYGAGGVPGGSNIPFTVDPPFEFVAFSFDYATKVLTIGDAPPPPQPASVAIAGNLQDELGCPGDWQADCAATDLGYDAEDTVWQGTFTIPAGSWEYKAPLNDSWDENYGLNATFNGPNILLDLDSPTAVKFYYEHGTHWITDNVNSTIATVTGNFQDELGCSGDWQPWCLRSWLQDPDGDGLYTVSVLLPEGSYEGKVAHDEGWDENYGAGGVPGGANIPFDVPAPFEEVTFSYDPVSHLLGVQVGQGGTAEPGDELLVRPPVRVTAQNDIFYFVLPDRFENSDPGNDSGGDLSGDPLVNGLLPTDKGYYHGGDLAGLTARLPYLDGLGVNAIWLTPQFKNQWVQGDGTIEGSSAGYHGYWQIDYSQIDPHFGSNAEMEAFITAAHGLGMQVFFDIVANHTGDIISYEEGVSTYRNKTEFPYRDADNVPFDDRDYAGTGTFPTLDPEISFPYTPFTDTLPASVKYPLWLNDLTYYHNRGNSTFSGENSLYGDFFGLDDLFTEHPDVQDGLIQIYKEMITDYDIDGFRIDTVKHVNDEMWEAFGPEIDAHAGSLGKTDFFFFGEVYDGDPANTSRFTTELPLHSVLDFGFQGSARNFASQSGDTDNLRNFYEKDDYYTDSDSNAYSLPTFLGNHDIGRIGHFLEQDNAGASDAELLARDKLAHALMYFGRGMPVVYYGDEQGFTGNGGDKDARQDMMPSVVGDYNDDDLIGTSATTADNNFDDTHSLYQTLSDYAALLNAHPALTNGAQLHRYSEPNAGIYAFSRIERTEKVEYIVMLNNSLAADSATFRTDSPSTSFTELWPGGGPSVTSDAAGNLAVDVPELGVKIYMASENIAVPGVAPVVTMNAPEAGAEVLGRVEVGASLSSAAYAEVTFAVSVDGGAFEPIGTDDNAPYRIFYDVSGLPAGTELVFKAIADNMSGAISSDKVSVVVGAEEPPTFAGFEYAIIHYNRPAGDYEDAGTGEFWGLHLWGDGIDPAEVTDWADPKPFEGEDEFGRFAWIKRGDTGSNVEFIIHKGDDKDTTIDRIFDANTNPEIWINKDDETIYANQADAQGYVTIHYHNPGGDYADWGLHLWGDAIDSSEVTTWDSPKPPTGTDDYGLYWEILIVDSIQPVNFIIHRGDEKDPGPDESFIPAEIPTVWKMSGDVEIYPSRGAAEDFATIHYHRDDGDYGDPTSTNFNDFWGMHVWTGALNPNPAWTDPLRWDRLDQFGPVFEVELVDGTPELAYIIHRGDDKDPGPDQFLTFDPWGYEVWQLSGADPENPYLLPILGEGAAPGDIDVQGAYWVAEDSIAWDAAGDPSADYRLYYAPTGGMSLGDVNIEGGSFIDLNLGAPFPDDIDGFLHLAGMPTFKIPAGDLALMPEILKGQIAVQVIKDGIRAGATGLQIPGVLDDLYTYRGELGVSWDGGVPTIRLWAPTARSVTFHLFDDAGPATSSAAAVMTLDPATGVWSTSGDSTWKGKYYIYEVEVYVHSTGQVENNLVTDPYSLSLAMNSTRSQIVDLNDAVLKPAGWDAVEKPALVAPEDISIYEIHVRDFSVNDDTVPAALKGTYKAFTLEDSNGVKHLQDLQEAGLTHLHLLPVFDIATINENKAEWVEADWSTLATYPPDSEEQQALVTSHEETDGFNWGYDPFHYTTPEGSYATDPDGTARIVEFREMVQSLNEDSDLRVVMDVVYNHTNAAGQDEKSVLDRIVPGYYHRLNDQGAVETSTCCANTASEHNMMEKLMIDSLVTWAKAYKVDAFRFDLMGHHMKRNMLEVRVALDALTLEEDGVDGSAIYIYGEGWNFGEVANNARGENATQFNMAGTGIGTFSDRLRDAVRGGSPFDGGQALVQNQGFANGLYYDPNVLNSGAPSELERLLLLTDITRVGMAGNLAGYEFVDRSGNLVTGAEVDYNGSPAGYTQDPQEDITYVSKHDNQTLYDNNTYKAPLGTSMADRVRIQNIGLSTVLLGQGVPFMHAGSDLLRSKSFDRDSYNSGDWFNKLDFSYQDNNYGVGLPVAGKNQDNWPIMQPLLADPALKADPEDIVVYAVLFQDLLAIRDSSPLFRLQTETDVQERVKFHNTGPAQIPGLIVMSLDDGDTAVDLDGHYEGMIVLINANDEAQTFTDSGFSGHYINLHSVQKDSIDPVVKTSSFDHETGTFYIPGRTTAVFVHESAEELIGDLIDQIEDLFDDDVLNKGQANSLIVKLRTALKQLEKGKTKQAINAMRTFIRAVKAFERGGKLPEEVAAELIMKAENIIEAIEVES